MSKCAPKPSYAEMYRAPGLRIKGHCLPTLPSATGFVVHSAYVTRAGIVEIKGERMEFQDVRIYLRQRIAGDDTP